MSHIRSAVVNNIYILQKDSIIGSNWISDNVSEKIAGKIGTKTYIYMKISVLYRTR